MKKLVQTIIALGFLLISIPALAYDTDPTVALKQPCVSVNSARAFLLKSKSTCDTPSIRVYFNVCKGEVVPGNAPLIADTLVGDAICPPTPLTEQIKQGVNNHMLIVAVIGFILSMGILILFASMFTVDQQTIAIIERFGAFKELAGPGLNFKNPFIDRISDYVDLRVQQKEIEVESKTKDDVTVGIKVMVQYQIPEENVYDAFYKLEDPENQIEAYVFDAIRAKVPSQTLDEIYGSRELDAAIEGEVRNKMAGYGYHIIDAPVTTVTPDDAVKDAMNQVNAQQRLLEAARSKGEADKVMTVKAAEAQAEAKALQGSGISRERLAIAKGLKESEDVFKDTVTGAEECMIILLITQYFDMLKSVGANSNTIMLPHSPAGLTDLETQMRNAVIAGSQALVNKNG